MTRAHVVPLRVAIRKNTVVGLFLLVICFLLPVNAAVVAADPDLPEILQHLDEWRQAFASIRVISHGWNRAHVLESNPDLDPNSDLEGNYYHRNEFLWADWGAMRYDTAAFREGKVVYRDALGCDGVQPWDAASDHGHGGEFVVLKLNRPQPDRPLLSRTVQEATHGLYCVLDASWINTRLRGASLERCEELDGHRCVVVLLEYEHIPGKPGDETYWLDPEFGFLPRKVVTRGTPWNKTGLEHYYTWTVDRFQKLEEGIWFPAQGNLLAGAIQPPGFEWVVKKVVLNESLARSAFGPVEVPPGTTVIDYAHGSTYRSGDVRKPASVEPPAASRRDPESSGVPVRAEPPKFSCPWLGLVGGVLTAAGLVARWSRRSRK